MNSIYIPWMVSSILSGMSAAEIGLFVWLVANADAHGTVKTSLRELVGTLGGTRMGHQRALEALKAGTLIGTLSGTRGTTITICAFEFFSVPRHDAGTPVGTQPGTPKNDTERSVSVSHGTPVGTPDPLPPAPPSPFPPLTLPRRGGESSPPSPAGSNNPSTPQAIQTKPAQDDAEEFDLIPLALDQRPEAQAVKAYNAMADRCDLPKVQKLHKTREAKLRARLKDCGGLDGWEAALAKVSASPFLTGQNDSGWRADFDFLMQESKFTKLMEGAYDGRPGGGGGGGDGFSQLLREMATGEATI